MIYTEKLIEIRKTITTKRKEIIDLENENEEVWKKLLREFNDNKARYRKMEGLSGLNRATFDSDEEMIIIIFDKNSKPSATALSEIEKDTGLQFKGNVDDSYRFGL